MNQKQKCMYNTTQANTSKNNEQLYTFFPFAHQHLSMGFLSSWIFEARTLFMHLMLEHIVGECLKNPQSYNRKSNSNEKKTNDHILIEKKDVQDLNGPSDVKERTLCL